MRSAKVKIAGQEYEINELASRKNAAFRQQLQDKLQDVARLIETAPQTEIDNGQAAAGLLRQVGNLLLGSIDTLIGLLLAYSPALEADKERIQDQAFDSELVTAFVEVLKLAYPFGQFAQVLMVFGRGASGKAT